MNMASLLQDAAAPNDMSVLFRLIGSGEGTQLDRAKSGSMIIRPGS